jgi:3',5'-cyclic AMP phosphodiesterase CpdA
VYEALKSVHSDFLLVTGDLAYDNGTLRQFEYYFFDIYKDLLALVPVFPASGNHDYQTRDGAVFREVFVLPEVSMSEGEERWYSFDWGPVHVAVLDTQVMLETQAEWLREDLDATDLPWKIVSLHKPSYSSGSHGSDDSMREIFGPVFRDHGVGHRGWWPRYTPGGKLELHGLCGASGTLRPPGCRLEYLDITCH